MITFLNAVLHDFDARRETAFSLARVRLDLDSKRENDPSPFQFHSI
jgi:hypothetical protein